MNSINFRGKTINYIQREGFWNNVSAGEWEPHSFDILDKYIKPGEAFIDIGAWNGVLSIYASMLGAVSYAIEPDEVCYKEIIENMSANNLSFDTAQIAISDKPAIVELTNITEGWGNSQSSIINRENSPMGVKVFADTLEHFVWSRAINKISLIKIDTEGSEVLIIPGSAKFFKQYNPVIYLSLHSYWFPDFWNNVYAISDTLWPIYNVYDAINGEELTPMMFSEMMKKYSSDEILLIPKA